MNKIITLAILFIVTSVSAQKYFTKNGTTNFKASVEAFEPVEATSKSTTAIINTENGEIAALLFIKSFHFDIALMEEHFNENYMGSDKYPKATFKGKIEGFSLDKLSAKAQNFKLKGILTIRDKKKEIDTLVSLKKDGDKVILNSRFSVQPQEFDIKIPKIVRKKIAESINISLDYELKEKK